MDGEITAVGLREAIVGLVLVLASLALAPLAAALARRWFPGRRVVFVRWGPSHVAIAVLVYFGLAAAGMAVLHLAGVSIAEQGELALAFEAALQGAVVLLIFGFARRLDPAGWRCLGLWRGGWGRALAIGTLAYVVAAPGLRGLMLIWAWILQELGMEAKPQAVLDLLLGLQGWPLVLFAVLATLVVPLFEELFFRAFLQPLLVQNLGDRGGVVVTAALFAGVHGNLFAFLPIFALALILGWVMLRTQRLVAVWLIHALHNGSMLALLIAEPHLRESLGQ